MFVINLNQAKLNYILVNIQTNITRVVDESGRVSLERCVHNQVVVYTEHVATSHAAATAHRLVLLLTLIGQYGSDDFTSIFNHHIAYNKENVNIYYIEIQNTEIIVV